MDWGGKAVFGRKQTAMSGDMLYGPLISRKHENRSLSTQGSAVDSAEVCFTLCMISGRLFSVVSAERWQEPRLVHSKPALRIPALSTNPLSSVNRCQTMLDVSSNKRHSLPIMWSNGSGMDEDFVAFQGFNICDTSCSISRWGAKDGTAY